MTDGLSTEQAPISVAQERTLNEAQVRDIVQREKASAAEKVRREMQAQYEREKAELQQAQQQQGSMGGMSQSVDPEKLKAEVMQDIMKQMQQAQQSAHYDNIAGEYLRKTAHGKTLYEDFDSVTAPIDGESFPNIVILTSKLDNAADVVYELGQHGLKLEAIESLAMRSPKLAERELQKISQSIKENKQALANHKTTNPPINGARPSVNAKAGSDDTPMTVSEMRKLPFMR